jgi:hypothetical protein
MRKHNTPPATSSAACKADVEDCTSNEVPVPYKFVRPLHDDAHKDYHDLKLNKTAKTPLRPAIPIAKKGDTDPKPSPPGTVTIKATKDALA